MRAFEPLFVFVGLVTYVSAQWVRHTEYYPNSPPLFMVGATPEQIEQFKRIIADRNLSAKEYDEQMEALVARLSPAAQEAYTRRINETKEFWQNLGQKFLEYASNLDEEARLVAKQLFDVIMASGNYTPGEVYRRVSEIYGVHFTRIKHCLCQL
ncbi:hypothetical protein Tcan_08923 [Toxocara canis]|uniref:SXP/RAL-2 family protein Ani s 5-like cation-binding domain-containing protein n=1 Tax=Toxocara canis TaxID=6265 RepID=A0A0B2VNX4_TOXCA|nr:hypothetical protein Tcan_08923 [Toxocara canis]